MTTPAPAPAAAAGGASSQTDMIAGAIERVLTAIGSDWTNLLMALVGVGIVTMAVIQLLKDVLPSRRWFQQWWLRRFWFYKHADRLKLTRDQAEEAMAAMVVLATAGDRKALFNLSAEQMTGQLNAAAQAVLDRPDEPDTHRLLLRLLAHSAEPDDLKLLLKGRPSGQAALTKYLEARNRVAQQIQRGLDAMQISLGFRWQWLMQVASVVISAGIIFYALAVYTKQGAWSGDRVLVALMVAILGGFLAPIARDLVAAVQSLRGRTR